MHITKCRGVLLKNIAILLFAIFFVLGRGYSQNSIPQNISLTELFEKADNKSKVIGLAMAGIEEADKKLQIAKTAQLPDIQLDASAAYLSDAKIVGLGTIPSGNYDSPNFYNSYTLEAACVVYAGGNINRAINISELQQQISKLGYQNTRMDIRLVLAGYYLDLYVIQNQIKVLEKNVGQTKVLIENMKSRLKAGTILRSDLIRYELQLSNLEFSLKKAGNKRAKLNQKLVETLDFSQDIQLCAIMPENAFAKLPDTLGVNNIGNNVDLQIAELQCQIAEKNVAVNKSNFLPNVRIFASSDFSRPYIYDLPPIDIYSNVWSAGLAVSFNIGKLYKNKSHVEQARIQLQESMTNYELSQEKIRIDLHDAQVDYNEAIEQLTVARKELELSSENYDMVINQYNNQLALITDVMDASNSKLNAELQLENSEAAILFASYKLKRIIGTL